jgi:hypothetical protein
MFQDHCIELTPTLRNLATSFETTPTAHEQRTQALARSHCSEKINRLKKLAAVRRSLKAE